MSDPTDYQGNSKKSKEPKPEKQLEKVVTGTVIIQKRTLGQKIKDTFVEADIRTVLKYVATDVLLPAARNMIVDASSKGVERLIYGERAIRSRNFGHGPRITYNDPINRDWTRRDYRDPRTSPPGRSRIPRAGRNDYLLQTREEAELVLERMQDVLDMYKVVSVADLNELVGFPTTHIDHKWGWEFLGDAQVRPIREGFLIDLPPAEAID